MVRIGAVPRTHRGDPPTSGHPLCGVMIRRRRRFAHDGRRAPQTALKKSCRRAGFLGLARPWPCRTHGHQAHATSAGPEVHRLQRRRDNCTFADRMLMEDIFSLIEGMTIAGFAVGADMGCTSARKIRTRSTRQSGRRDRTNRRLPWRLRKRQCVRDRRVGAGAYICGGRNVAAGI